MALNGRTKAEITLRRKRKIIIVIAIIYISLLFNTTKYKICIQITKLIKLWAFK